MEHDTIIQDGPVTKNDLQQYSWFDKTYAAYHPDTAIIDQLKGLVNGVSVLTVMGTWCGDSKEHVPAFFHIAALTGLNKMETIAVNRKKKSDHFDVTPLGIEYVPTFIFFKNGKEIGRIIETPEETLEKDMLKILQAAN